MPFRARHRALEIYPPDIHLATSRARQTYVVRASYADGITRDVTTEAKTSVANTAVVTLDKNLLTPLADGKTELQAQFGGAGETRQIEVFRELRVARHIGEGRHGERCNEHQADGQPIQAVGEIHRIRRPDNHQNHEREEKYESERISVPVAQRRIDQQIRFERLEERNIDVGGV